MGVSGQQLAPAALNPRERPGTHFTGGSVGRSGRDENLVPTGIRSRTVHPVVSRYTECNEWNEVLCFVLFCVMFQDHWLTYFCKCYSMYFPINVTVSWYPMLLIFLTLKNRPIRWRTLCMAFKEFNRKATFGSPTPFSPWFFSKAHTIWRVYDFTGYNYDVVFSVADKVEEWVIGHEREEFRSSRRISHWNKTIFWLDTVRTDVLLTGWGHCRISEICIDLKIFMCVPCINDRHFIIQLMRKYIIRRYN